MKWAFKNVFGDSTTWATMCLVLLLFSGRWPPGSNRFMALGLAGGLCGLVGLVIVGWKTRFYWIPKRKQRDNGRRQTH